MNSIEPRLKEATILELRTRLRANIIAAGANDELGEEESKGEVVEQDQKVANSAIATQVAEIVEASLQPNPTQEAAINNIAANADNPPVIVIPRPSLAERVCRILTFGLIGRR